MCGFVGSIIPHTSSVLHHRGPDGSGQLATSLSWASVSLEMTRLKIVDQRSIVVPFTFPYLGIVFAYNGEVYNWRALREELSDGTPWMTECDAEVVARAWRRWGPAALDRFNGMWGMCLVDEREGVVFLARDRAGEKPLYYAPLGQGICFASEVKALPIRFEETPCAELETLEFDCLETTPFKDVRRLGPGEYLFLDSPKSIARPQPKTWWTLSSEVDESMSWARAVDETHALLVDAIRLRAAAEVPVAVQLSGGLDSALIQAVVKSDRLYCVTFPEADNLTAARLASCGREIKSVTFGLADLLEALPKVAWHLDTPATWTAVCQWFMNRQIAEDGAVVVLSGEGADELFGGYSRYRALYWLMEMQADQHLEGYHSLCASLFGDILAKMLNRGGDATLAHARLLVDIFGGKGDLVQRMSRVDFHTTMACLLRMADTMAAAHSLENRSPFLDYRVMELAAIMPMRWKVTASESKAVLREVARRLGVPGVVVDERTKKGLFIPWAAWRGEKGWDRSSFAVAMREAWRKVFFDG